MNAMNNILATPQNYESYNDQVTKILGEVIKEISAWSYVVEGDIFRIAEEMIETARTENQTRNVLMWESYLNRAKNNWEKKEYLLTKTNLEQIVGVIPEPAILTILVVFLFFPRIKRDILYG
jgi:hypothetical protein